MRIAIWFIAAIPAWYVGGMNPAIFLSNRIYQQDIREIGSGNPGFTNFRRAFGNRYAWLVFVLDLLKSVVLCVPFGLWFDYLGYNFQIGVTYTGLFVLLGHSFPLQYRLKGGKGFLVLLAELFILDWRVGLIAFVEMAILLRTTGYMSLSTISALVLGAVLLFLLDSNMTAAVIYAVCVVFMIIRHKENIKRLINGTETKFYLESKL